MPTDMKTFFGGSFFSQLDSDEARDKLESFLPEVDHLSDDEVLSQFAELAGETES